MADLMVRPDLPMSKDSFLIHVLPITPIQAPILLLVQDTLPLISGTTSDFGVVLPLQDPYSTILCHS